MSAAFRTIGCCIDHSPAAVLAAAEGVRLARAMPDAALHLVHVVQAPPTLHAGPYTYVEPASVVHADEVRWLERRAQEVEGATPVLLEGDPAEAVCAWADEAGADLLIVARHRGRVARALHGTFAGRVAENAPCPVLVLRPPG